MNPYDYMSEYSDQSYDHNSPQVYDGLSEPKRRDAYKSEIDQDVENAYKYASEWSKKAADATGKAA